MNDGDARSILCRHKNGGLQKRFSCLLLLSSVLIVAIRQCCDTTCGPSSMNREIERLSVLADVSNSNNDRHTFIVQFEEVSGFTVFPAIRTDLPGLGRLDSCQMPCERSRSRISAHTERNETQD